MQCYFNNDNQSERVVDLKALLSALKKRQPDRKGKTKADLDDDAKKEQDACHLMELEVHLRPHRLDVDTFYIGLFTPALTTMVKCLAGLGQRQHGNHINRILSTSGLKWNDGSSYKARDFSVIALAAALETVIVPAYRANLFSNLSKWVKIRDEICEAFQSMMKPIEPDPPAAQIHAAPAGLEVMPFMPGSDHSEILPWMFADRIDSMSADSRSPVFLNLSKLTHITMDSMLDRTFRLKENKEMHSFKKLFEPILKSRYIACSNEGVAPQTIETSAHFFLCQLLTVSVSFILHILIVILHLA